MKFSKVCVLGLGYIGLPTASTLATHGLDVVGVDVNARVIDTLQEGKLHIHEPGLSTLVRAAVGSGNLQVSLQPEASDAFIIAVPTPFQEDKSADLSYVDEAARSILPFLQAGNLVVLESTSPPRTTVDRLVPILEESGLKAGADFHLCYSPERVLPGQILRELIENARVIGGVDEDSAQAGRDLYKTFVRGEIILTDATTAEMVKLMENTYRDVNIGIANEFSRLAQRFGIDIWETVEIANRHPRVQILRPGPGVGGHCISVDPWFLVEAAPDITTLIQAARQVNDEQPGEVVEVIRKALESAGLGPGFQGRRIAVLGLAYKADVDDMRESPAVEVVNLLQEGGALVKAYDPYQGGTTMARLKVDEKLEDALADAELVVLLVAHKLLKRMEPGELAEISPARVVVDVVNGWDRTRWESAGFFYSSLGVGKRE